MGLINSLKGEVNKNLSFMERKQLINSKFVSNDYHEKLLKLDGTFSNNTQSNSASETETLDFNEDSLANNVKMYEVKSGDSLSKIAQENGTTVEELVKINNIDNPNVIHPNQEIILPDSSTVDITETIDNVYVVKNGDSLSKIAQENGTTVEELCKLNGIDEKDYIKTGQKIKVSQDSSEVTSGSGLQNGSVNSSASGSTDTSGGNGTSSSNGEFSQAGSDNSSSQKGINNSLKDGKDSSLGESMPKKVEVSKYKISENTTEAPELDVDDEKALYIHYIQVMKDILSEHGIQTEKGVTNYETIVSFGKFLSNKSSNLSEDEVENFTGFYNSILEEQILLLQSDKEVFDDFVKYLNVSEEEQKELYSEFEKGNGISAMAYSEIVNINSKISEVEKETKKLNEELSKYSNGNFKYYDDVLGAQKSEISQKIKENKKSLSELKQQRYNLQQQYNKSLYNYLIDLRDNKDYKELIKLDGKVQIEKLDLSTPEGSTKLTDFPLEELKSAILSRGPVFIQGDPEFADYNITANNCIEIIETLYQDDEFVKTVLGNEKEKTRKNFIDSCFGNATDIQSEFNKVLRVYSYMSDDQVNDYLYLLKKDGEGPERAINYVDALQDDANRYYGEIRAKEELEKIISKKTTIEEVLSSFGISTKDGIEGALNNLSITFTGDTTTTVQQYASQYFLQTLELSSMFTELDENDIQDMINDKDNPLDPTIAKYLKTLEHPTGLDILLKSEQITEEDYKFYLSLKEKEPYKQYIEELANKGEVNKLCIKYAYNTGLNVGNMLPSIATSAVFSFAGLASIGQSAASLVMFGGAYGSAYQQGIQSGKDMNDAVMYAMISASSEVLTERFLGRTPGISNAKKFVETSAEAVYTSTKSLFINTLKTVAADLVCEVSEEELQNIIEIIDDGFTGGTFDFSGIKEESVDTAVVTVLSTLILGLPTNAINTKNSYVNMKDFNNGKFSIKLEDGTVVPMTMDYLTKNNIVDAKAKEINLEKLHEYFAECKNNDVVSIDKKTSSEIIGIINQKLKEQGIDKTYSEITLMGYDGNVAVYGSEIANLIEQLVPIEKSEYKKGSYIRDAKKVISNVSSKMSDRISNLKTNMTEISSNVVNGFKNIKESSLEFSKHLSPSNSKKEFINFVQNFEYQNPNMYNSISEIDSSTKNQVRTYGDMKKLEKKLNSVFNMKDIDYKKAAYRALVSISNADVRALPTNQEITSFYKKFSNTEKYIISDFQKGSFSHIKSVDYNEKTTKRLYINNVNFSDTITFSTLFAEKCEERGIPFYFKTADMSRGAENIKKLNLTRDESIVIYSSDKYITDYVNICEEIREETQMKFNAPPVLSGVVNDFLGYGDEYLNHRISYNSLRSEVVSSALKETNKAYFGKEYNVESLMENLRKDSSKYKSYLTLFYNNIKKYSKINGVDSNSFFLNAKENVQTGQTKTETLDNLVENLPNSQSMSQNDGYEKAHQILQDDIASLKQEKMKTEQSSGLEQTKTEALDNLVENLPNSQSMSQNDGYEKAHQILQEDIASLKQEKVKTEQSSGLEQTKTEALDDLVGNFPNSQSTSQNDGYEKAHQILQEDIASLKQEKVKTEQSSGLEQIKTETLKDLIENFPNSQSTSQSDGYEKAHQILQEDIASLKQEKMKTEQSSGLEQTKTETLDNLVENLPNSQSTSQNDSTEIQKIYSESRDTFTQIQKKELIKNKIKKYSNSILNLFFNVEEDDVIDKATDLVLEKGIEVSLAYDIAVRMLEDGYSYDYALESINIEKEAIDNRVSRDVVWFAKLNNISDLKLAECMYDYGLNEKYAKMVIENGEDAKVMQILCKNEESIYNVSNNDIGVAEKIATIMLTKDITDPRMALLFLKYPGISKNVAKIMADYNNITYELAIYMEKNNINNPYVADLMQKGISKDLALFMVLTKVNNPDIASIMMKNGFPPKIAEELYINKRNILDWESWSKNYKKDTERISQLASSKVKKIFDAYTNTSESLVNSHMGYYGFLNQIMRGNFYNEKTGCINWGSTIGTVEMTIENFEREILNDTTSAGQFYEDQLVAGSIMNNFINNYGSLKESAVLIRGADIESLMSVMGYNGQKMNLKGKKIEEIADLINNSELFYNDKGFMSCSVEPMDVTTGRNVIYVIDCKSGTKALTTDFGFGGKEHEVLLGANQKFKMQKADVKDGILYIYMRN